MTLKRLSTAIIFFVLSAAAAHAQAGPLPAASFNCAAAKTPDKQIICADRALRQDDSLLASSFLAALAAHPDKQGVLHHDEREWLATRNAMCGVTWATNIRDAAGQVKHSYVSCFQTLYNARTLYLQALAEPTKVFLGRAPGVLAIITAPGSHVTFSFAPPPVAGLPGVNPTPAETAAKVKQAQSEMLAIVARIRALYPGAAGFNLPTHTDITCVLAAKGVFPAAMLQDGVCHDGSRWSYPRSPWGTPVTIYAPWADNAASGNDTFQVDFQLYGTGQGPCAALINASLSSRQDSRLLRVWTAGGPALDPSTGVLSAPFCSDAGFDFRL